MKDCIKGIGEFGIEKFKQLKEAVRRSDDYLLVAVDVAKRRHEALLMDGRGRVYRRRLKFSNNLKGFNRLYKEAEKVRVQHELKGILVGMEPTAGYWKPLAHYCRMLSEGGGHWEVVTVRPAAVAANRKTLDTTPEKSDSKDTQAIGDLMSQGKFHLCLLRQGRWARLCRYLRMYYQAREKASGCKVRIRHVYGEIFPELELAGKDLFSVRWRRVLREYPLARDLVELGCRELGRRLCRYGRRRRFMAEGEQVWEWAQQTVGVETEGEAVRVELEWLWEELECQEQRAAELRRRLVEQVQGDGSYRRLLTIPGVGPLLAAGLVAEIGEIRFFGNYKELVSFAGLDVIGKRSGGWVSERRVISKLGRKYLRTVAYQAALGAIGRPGEFQQCYRRALARQGEKKVKRKALVKVAEKMLRVVYGVLKKDCDYEADYYRQGRRQREVA